VGARLLGGAGMHGLQHRQVRVVAVWMPAEPVHGGSQQVGLVSNKGRGMEAGKGSRANLPAGGDGRHAPRCTCSGRDDVTRCKPG